MAEDTLSSEFYWNNIVLKVEDTLFCVPRCGFVQSSEVFADMFLLPSGPETCTEGQDREHPIVLEGYKKDEFASLLRVMYPIAESLISGTNLEVCLEKEEWVSVLKLSTIWGMKKIRQYAIHRLSTVVTLSPIEKILLARAHRVAAWLNEAVTSLASSDASPTLDELVRLGWETAAQILWIRDNSSRSPNAPNTLRFRRHAIQCASCSSSSSLINSDVNCRNCGQVVSENQELTYPGPGSPISGTADHLVSLRNIQCQSATCRGSSFYSSSFHCSSCSYNTSGYDNVRITPNKGLKELIEGIFGEEIKDYELATTVA